MLRSAGIAIGPLSTVGEITIHGDVAGRVHSDR